MSVDSGGAGAAVLEQDPGFANMVGPAGEMLLLDQSTGLLYVEDDPAGEVLYGFYDGGKGACIELPEGMDELDGARLPQRHGIPGFKEKLLNEHNVRTFARTGMVVLDGVVPADLVAAVRGELDEAARTGDIELEAPGNNQSIRQDKVVYLPFFAPQQDMTAAKADEDDEDGEVSAVEVAAALLESVGAELNEAFGAGSGVEGGAPLPTLLRPEMFMLAEYDTGASYKPHRDCVQVEEGKPDAWCNPRVCTAILYLNNKWSPSSGGQLRCFVGADSVDDAGSTCQRPRDVPPIGGRIIVFKSQDLLHAVLPSFRPRKAMTVR